MENDDEQKLNVNHRLPVKYVLPDEWHRRWEVDYREYVTAYIRSTTLRIQFARRLGARLPRRGDFRQSRVRRNARRHWQATTSEHRRTVGASGREDAEGGESSSLIFHYELIQHCADIDAHLENLMKELGMMIKVGTHENVISLIGFCTSNTEGGITYPQ